MIHSLVAVSHSLTHLASAECC